MTIFNKRHNIVLIISILLCTNIYAQNLGVHLGLNQNHFYDNQDNSPHIDREYQSKIGFNLEFTLNNLYLRDFDENSPVDSLQINFSLGVEYYGGQADTRRGGLGGSSNSKVNTEKMAITFSVFPVNFNLRSISFGAGLSVNLLVYSKEEVVFNSWTILPSSEHQEVVDFSTPEAVGMGLAAYLAYNISLNKNWSLKPQYVFFYGLTNDVFNAQFAVKSFRHYFKIGLTRAFSLTSAKKYRIL